MNLETQKAGGIARGVIQRQKSLSEYYANPNYCKQCLNRIEVAEKVSETKRKMFCNHHCASVYNNAKRPKKLVVRNTRIRTYVGSVTKSELFAKRSGWQSARSSIRRHAQIVYLKSGKSQTCSECGYFKHVEIAHKKSVSSFEGTATIDEINSIDNLVALCPNHHWEFDNLNAESSSPV